MFVKATVFDRYKGFFELVGHLPSFECLAGGVARLEQNTPIQSFNRNRAGTNVTEGICWSILTDTAIDKDPSTHQTE